MSMNISIKTEADLAIKILAAVADNIDNAKSGYDFGEMSPDEAFSAAIRSVSYAIRDAIRDLPKNPSAG